MEIAEWGKGFSRPRGSELNRCQTEDCFSRNSVSLLARRGERTNSKLKYRKQKAESGSPQREEGRAESEESAQIRSAECGTRSKDIGNRRTAGKGDVDNRLSGVLRGGSLIP